MATLVFSTTTGTAILEALFNAGTWTHPTNVYISLHTADPGTTGASECTGGSYARQNATSAFAAASGKAIDSNADLSFAGMPATTVTHVGVWDAVTTGTFLCGGTLSASKTVGAGETFKIPSGSFDVSIS